MKKMFVVMIMGMALLTGCGAKEKAVETETQMETTAETQAETKKQIAMTDVKLAKLYPAIEEIIGEELEGKEVICDDTGVYIGERFMSWEYIEECNYNS